MLKFVVELSEAIDLSLQDGKFDLNDVSNLIKPMFTATEAFADIKEIPSEIANLTEEQKNELNVYLQEELELSSEKTEKVVELGFKIALDLAFLVQALKK